MDPETVNLAVCFADICDSTRLFEQEGDDRARDIVANVLGVVADVVEEYDGRVVKTIGDEVMAVFPELLSAVSAVTQFPEAVAEHDNLDALGIRIRVGMCYGPVLREADGDVYGDAVNTASRLVDWANPSQVVTTEAVLDHLPDFVEQRSRPLGPVKLRGKEESIAVVELLDQQSGTDLTVVGGRPDPDTPSTDSVLFLKYDDDTIQVGQEPVVLGRGSQCDIVISDSRVSRTHAIIEHERGTFVLKDTSTNGTYVQVGKEDVLFLHRDQLKLHGSGRIRPGRTLDEENGDTQSDSTLFFACESGESS